MARHTRRVVGMAARVAVAVAAATALLLQLSVSVAAPSIPCSNGRRITVSVEGGAEGETQQVCECWGAVRSQGILSNTFYGPACAQQCRPYCSDRGMCSITTPGVCTCDDPMHWEGDRCEVRLAIGDPGDPCSVGLDCTSGVCKFGFCTVPSCGDGVQNGNEVAVDCGGTCGPCDAGTPCNQNSDCASGVCAAGACAAARCDDDVRNGDESDVDCGGSACAPCGTGQACAAEGDCVTCGCNSDVCSARTPACGDVSVCEFRRAMSTPCPLCATYLPYLNAALREYDMTCPTRYSALLAHVAVATGGLPGELPADTAAGTGSALALPVAGLRRACVALPTLYAAFGAEFAACAATAGSQANVCATCGTTAQVAELASRPGYAFRIAAWWFASGSNAEVGPPCFDLRADADVGLGTRGAGTLPTRGNPGTGFHKTVPCVGGFDTVSDAKITTLVQRYYAIRRLWDPLFPSCTSASAATCSGVADNTAWFTEAPLSCSSRSCDTCTSCGATGTQFQVGGCTNVFDRQCKGCSTCPNGLAVLSPCSATSDTVCSPCRECTATQYQTQACTPGQDTVCADCTVCGADEWERQACGGSSDTDCAACPAAATQFPDCSATLSLTAADMVQLAGCEPGHTACEGMAPHLAAALAEFHMSCPLRAAAFVAQVRYATGFTLFKQLRAPSAAPGDAPVWLGGAIPLLPANARAFCRNTADIATLFATEVGTGCPSKDADPCACGSDEAIAAVLSKPSVAFRAGAWWFARGARGAIGAPCSDLRGDADYGIGAFGLPQPGPANPGIGFRKITSCILGFGPVLHAAQTQREAMYIQAMRFWEPSYLLCPSPAHAWPACNDGVRNGLETCTDGGGACPSKCALGANCAVDSDCDQAGSPGLRVCSAADGWVCAEVSVAERCSDGIRNGDELGVDCGASCGANCPDGTQCTGAQDCESGACVQGKCAPCVNGDRDDSGVCTCWGADRDAGTFSKTWFGADCSQSCRTERCRGRGVCSAQAANECECDEPLLFTGAQCEQSTCNHGYAVYQTPTSVSCECSPGWAGDTCNAPVSCVHGTWYGGACDCDAGWSGASCSVPVGIVEHCSGHGVWDSTNFACVCNSGWLGGQCDQVWEETYAQPMCFIGAWTNNGTVCSCDDFWHGDMCQHTSCVYGNVKLGVGGAHTCQCIDSTWTGAGCANSTRGTCMFRGQYQQATATCLCDHGYSGPRCQVMEWAADGSSASTLAFQLVSESLGDDADAKTRVVHAPQLCNTATAEQDAPVGTTCLPFELAVLSLSAVTATITLDSAIVAQLPQGTSTPLALQETTASVAARLGVDAGSTATLGSYPDGCGAGVLSATASPLRVTARLCPGRFYYVRVGDWDGIAALVDGSGSIGSDISGQEVGPDFNAGPRATAPLAQATAIAVAIAAAANAAAFRA